MISFWDRLLNLISPQPCAMCGRRLSISEELICCECNLDLPRTNYDTDPYSNELAHCFWGLIPVERCYAFTFYRSKSLTSHIIYGLKYGGRREWGVIAGRMIAREIIGSGFFEGIDLLLPVPLTCKRRRSRGYNQSEELARGIGEVTEIPIETRSVRRKIFTGSQTSRNRWQRVENVADAFELVDAGPVHARHVLIVDDVVTTGATIRACAQQLVKAGVAKISVLAFGFAKS